MNIINYGNINGIFKPQLLKETKKPLDEFFSLHMSVKDTFAKLWSVCKIILVLSHGQSNVESGFSINKEMVRCNMDESTVITSRIIKDSIHSFGGIKNVPINKALISEYKASHFRYKMDRKNKINEDNETVEKKRKGDELVRLKCEKKSKLDDIQSHNKQINRLIDDAASSNKSDCMAKVVQVQALKNNIKVLEKSITKLTDDIEKLIK